MSSIRDPDSDPDALVDAEPPRKLVRGIAGKEPALRPLISAALADYSSDSMSSGDGSGAIDLNAYFAKFPHVPPAAKIAVCRAYASMLASSIRANNYRTQDPE